MLNIAKQFTVTPQNNEKDVVNAFNEFCDSSEIDEFSISMVPGPLNEKELKSQQYPPIVLCNIKKEKIQAVVLYIVSGVLPIAFNTLEKHLVISFYKEKNLNSDDFPGSSVTNIGDIYEDDDKITEFLKTKEPIKTIDVKGPEDIRELMFEAVDIIENNKDNDNEQTPHVRITYKAGENGKVIDSSFNNLNTVNIVDATKQLMRILSMINVVMTTNDYTFTASLYATVPGEIK